MISSKSFVFKSVTVRDCSAEIIWEDCSAEIIWEATKWNLS
jgi:hypothetical protein